jgi:hypothetical protein
MDKSIYIAIVGSVTVITVAVVIASVFSPAMASIASSVITTTVAGIFALFVKAPTQ